MLRTCLSVAIITLLSTPAVAADSPFYVGGQIGATKIKESVGSYSESLDFTTLSALVGYQFSDYLAAEVRLGTGVKGEKFHDGNYTDKFTVSHKNLLLLKGIVPVNDSFMLYGLAGFGSIKYKYEEQTPIQSYSETLKADGFSWGVGAGFNITSNWTAALEYLQLPEEEINDDDYTFKAKSSSVNLSIIYRF